jgi:hypothetical protein
MSPPDDGTTQSVLAAWSQESAPGGWAGLAALCDDDAGWIARPTGQRPTGQSSTDKIKRRSQ